MMCYAYPTRAGVTGRRTRRSQDEEAMMAQRNRRHVVPNPAGGWDVKKPGANRASAHTDTKAAAERRAREIVRNAGGGEIVRHGLDGRIQDSDTIPRGNDPFPPRDARH